MSPSNNKVLSPFGQAALTLDSDFSELDRLSGQISRLDIESDNGLDRSKQLLVKFSDCGQRIAEGLVGFGKILDEMRNRADTAAEAVAGRAILVQERQTQYERMLERFRSLGEMAGKTTATVAKFKNLAGAQTSAEEKALLAEQLTALDSLLTPLVNEAHKLKEDVRQSKMKTLERNVDSLEQSLEFARRKLAHSVSEFN